MTLLDMGLGLASLLAGPFFAGPRPVSCRFPAACGRLASRLRRLSRATMVRDTISGKLDEANGNSL
ncbi:MAG: hypothetical protein PPHEMADM_3870 [uncultured Paraburkholderia sp.]|nr:MAG: hypothetical protein PPHEINF_2074 [uncultured Paraburkholderia sp.]CAH2785282.1 MAG: hypothetical protein PPHEESC_2033 [uncultured Paraburkholderia sp.]CAH2899823.1 MAG: hypothetical protein PPHEMADE_3816 [uncultured Paraburkholderia sp.]CAH2918877.1 MAG: hypothetical protein PPHERAN_1869 [uncultured Paraburkholderia sp.]CAH2920453.1 MAG: hypothetical protein PPHEMADMSA_2105 [uncultured Paraburkholderia sp.]